MPSSMYIQNCWKTMNDGAIFWGRKKWQIGKNTSPVVQLMYPSRFFFSTDSTLLHWSIALCETFLEVAVDVLECAWTHTSLMKFSSFLSVQYHLATSVSYDSVGLTHVFHMLTEICPVSMAVLVGCHFITCAVQSPGSFLRHATVAALVLSPISLDLGRSGKRAVPARVHLLHLSSCEYIRHCYPFPKGESKVCLCVI